MVGALVTSVYCWIELTKDPYSAAGFLFAGINDILFPSLVILSVLFHTLTYTLLLFKVYHVIKQRKNKDTELKMKVARNRLSMFLGLVVVAMPVFVYAETITYEDPMKEFLIAISFDLLGLNVIAMVYLFQAIGLLLKSDKRPQNRNVLSIKCVEPTDTKAAMDGHLVTATELI
jgi:hypothetical protein